MAIEGGQDCEKNPKRFRKTFWISDNETKIHPALGLNGVYVYARV